MAFEAVKNVNGPLKPDIVSYHFFCKLYAPRDAHQPTGIMPTNMCHLPSNTPLKYILPGSDGRLGSEGRLTPEHTGGSEVW